MGTEVINVSSDVLKEELDRAKSTLKDLNDNIRRISGREPPDQLRLGYQIAFFSAFTHSIKQIIIYFFLFQHKRTERKLEECKHDNESKLKLFTSSSMSMVIGSDGLRLLDV